MPDINIERETHIRISDVITFTGDPTELLPDAPNMVEYTTGIESGSLFLNQMLVDKKIIFGKLTAARFEVRLHIDEDVTGKEITVWQVENPDSANPTINYLFNGIIYSAKLNANDYFRNIVAYDKSYYVSQIDVASWWSSFWEQRTSYPNLLDIVRLMCYQYGILVDTWQIDMVPSIPVTYTSKMNFTKISFSSLLQLLCESFAFIPYMTPSGQLWYNDNGVRKSVDGLGKLRFFDPGETSFYSIDLRNKFEINNSEISDIVVEAPQWPLFLLEDGHSWPAPTSILGGIHVFAYNPILTGMSNNTLNTLHNFCTTTIGYLTNYRPAKIKMIVSDPHIKLGERLQITDTGYTYNFETTLSGALLIEQEFNSLGEEEPFTTTLIDNSLASDIGVADTTTPAITNLETAVNALQSDISTAQTDITDIQSDVVDLQTEYINIDERLKYLEYRSITNSLIAKDKVILTTDNGESITVF